MARVKKLSDTELTKQIRSADRRSQIARSSEPRAKSANYEPASRLLHIGLTNGGAIEIPVALIPELDGIRPAQLKNVSVDPLGAGLLWRDLGIGLDFVAILERVFGTSFGSAAARHLGSKTSKAKAEASRANGLKGGRPRKTNIPVAHKRSSSRKRAEKA
jgi:hypothetical protein